MRVGTKLLAVVLPPLLVLVVVAGLGARDRMADASNAQSAESYIELTEGANEAITALQRERLLSVLEAAAPGSATTLAAQRTTTDGSLAAYQDRAAAVDPSPEVARTVEQSTTRQGDITTIRASIDRGNIDPTIVDKWYLDAIADLLDVQTAVSNEIPFAEVSADLTALVTSGRAAEALSQQNATFTIALGQGQFDPAGRLWRDYWARDKAAQQNFGLFFSSASPEQQADVRRVEQGPPHQNVYNFADPVMTEVAATVNWLGDGSLVAPQPLALTPAFLSRTAEVPAGMEANVETWVTLTDAEVDGFAAPKATILEGVTAEVSAVRSEAESATLLYLVITVLAIVGSTIMALVVARRISKPLRNLTEAADRLSTEQLPALVERLKSPGASRGEVILEPINMKRGDEIGHLADAFDAIQRVTVEVAEEQQSLLKKGIGDIFVNLARRNQSLLDRQIEFIDQLESQEEDPDVLEDLFKLDHLATRMRRNAESLLVLAGVETTNRRARPVSLADVVRVAVGEVEDFARLNLVSLDDAVVTGGAAMDVAHLLSELMENATAFSPPETAVEVLGHLNNDGSYVLSISDQGIGMSDEQFTDTNKLLAEPPLVGLTLSRSLGFTVVARLAARFNIDVRLTSSPTGGVTALVTLPPAVLEQATISIEPDATPVAEAPAPVVHEAPEVVEDVAIVDEPGADEPQPIEWIPDAPAPSTLAGAVPEGAAFDAGLAALIGESEDAPAGEPAEPVAEVPSLFGGGDPAPETAASPEPVRTSAGLVKRVPRASVSATDTGDRVTAEAPVARTQRSPEEVRAMLSRYRSGLHRGRDGEMSNGSSNDGQN